MATRTRSRKTAAPAAALPFGLAGAAPMLKFAQELRRWTDNVLSTAGSAGELSLNMAKMRANQPREQQAIEKAGAMLRQARETAGMTTRELGRAVDLSDPALLERAEAGAAALPIEVVLRLAGVLARNDPMGFAMQLGRTYNPTLWKALDALGFDRLVALAERERQMANIYRANDGARELSDADFAEVLGFVKNGFDMAVKFRRDAAAATRRPKPTKS